jgi:hypothetical protein
LKKRFAAKIFIQAETSNISRYKWTNPVNNRCWAYILKSKYIFTMTDQ